MPKSANDRTAGRDAAGGAGRPGNGGGKQPGAESVPRPDQTRSLDFTGVAEDTPEPAAAPPGSVLEEAALLYAGDEPARARALLERGIDASPARAWLMLLELHQELGEHAQFDARTGAFKTKFGRVAPAWRELAPRGDDAMLRTGGGAYVALRGRLSAQSASQLDQVRAVVREHGLLRIDLAGLQGADAAGCDRLLHLLHAIRHGGAQAVLTGEHELLGALAHATRPGDREADRALWLLRLEILQNQGRRPEFEAVAQQYAQTYGEPPPRFEAPAPQRASARGEHDVLRAPAEVLGNPDVFFGAIAAAAATHADVVVDCGNLRRIDVSSAHTLRNVAAKLEDNGKRLELRQVNALVVALLEATGVSTVATVVPRH